MAHAFHLAIGDLVPAYAFRCETEDGDPIPLSASYGASPAPSSVQFHLRASGAATPFLMASIVNREAASGVGCGDYEWQAGNTATEGFYEARVHIMYPGSRPLSVPNNGFKPVVFRR